MSISPGNGVSCSSSSSTLGSGIATGMIVSSVSSSGSACSCLPAEKVTEALSSAVFASDSDTWRTLHVHLIEAHHIARADSGSSSLEDVNDTLQAGACSRAELHEGAREIGGRR